MSKVKCHLNTNEATPQTDKQLSTIFSKTPAKTGLNILPIPKIMLK
jgi:hypothetical protein